MPRYYSTVSRKLLFILFSLRVSTVRGNLNLLRRKQHELNLSTYLPTDPIYKFCTLLLQLHVFIVDTAKTQDYVTSNECGGQNHTKMFANKPHADQRD